VTGGEGASATGYALGRCFNVALPALDPHIDVRLRLPALYGLAHIDGGNGTLVFRSWAATASKAAATLASISAVTASLSSSGAASTIRAGGQT